HRCQQRQVAVGEFDSLERNAGEADVEELLRQDWLGRQVQVAEQEVVLAQVLQVAGDRLLHLHDQLALLIQRGGIGSDVHPELGVLLVLETALQARALLQPHFVATLDKVTGGGRHESDATLEGLGFLGYTDAHCGSLKVMPWVTANRGDRADCHQAGGCERNTAVRRPCLVMPGRQRHSMAVTDASGARRKRLPYHPSRTVRCASNSTQLYPRS